MMLDTLVISKIQNNELSDILRFGTADLFDTSRKNKNKKKERKRERERERDREIAILNGVLTIIE